MLQLFQTDKIFTSLVKEINSLINEDVIITNEEGIIVASTDLKRVDHFHEGAFLAMKNQEKIMMTDQLCEQLEGVRKGIVLPIIIEDRPIGVLGITGNPPEVEPYARIVQKMAALFIKGTIDQMTQEKMARNLELFVFDWINGSIPEVLIKERGEFFNVNVNNYKQVICFDTPFLTNDLSYKEILTLRMKWDQKGDAIFVRWGQGRLLVIDKQYERHVLKDKINTFLKTTEDQLGKEIYVGVGQAITGYTELSASFEQAERACKIAGEDKQVIFEEELRFEMVQYELSGPTKEKFIERTIAPLVGDKIMLQTLSTWLENNMSIQETSECLHIHKNTLYYRLEKIEKLTNLDLKKIEDTMLLYIGNKFLNDKNFRA